jgi:hypothetical protein
MADGRPEPKGTLALIKKDLKNGGPYAGIADYVDPTTPGSFGKDMEGYFTDGTDSSGSNYADAFLGSYKERWWAIPNGNGTATAYFRVRNETDLNAFAHPEYFTGGGIRSIDGAQPEIDTAVAPADPWAFSPQYETFEWQVPIGY